jgi:hypothetical protein
MLDSPLWMFFCNTILRAPSILEAIVKGNKFLRWMSILEQGSRGKK